MKKLLSIIAIALLIAGLSTGSAMAADGDLGDNPLTGDVYCIINSDSSIAIATLIPITDIIPGKSRITRIEVMPLAVTSAGDSVGEWTVSMNDKSSIHNVTDKTVECEMEVDGDGGSAVKEYTRPYLVQNGCVITQGPRTVVTVEWEYYRP